MTEPLITIADPDAELSDVAITAMARLLIDFTRRELQEQETKNASSGCPLDEAS